MPPATHSLLSLSYLKKMRAFCRKTAMPGQSCSWTETQPQSINCFSYLTEFQLSAQHSHYFELVGENEISIVCHKCSPPQPKVQREIMLLIVSVTELERKAKLTHLLDKICNDICMHSASRISLHTSLPKQFTHKHVIDVYTHACAQTCTHTYTHTHTRTHTNIYIHKLFTQIHKLNVYMHTKTTYQ